MNNEENQIGTVLLNALIIISNGLIELFRFLYHQIYCFISLNILGIEIPKVINEEQKQEVQNNKDEDKNTENSNLKVIENSFDGQLVKKRGYAIEDLVTSEANYLTYIKQMVDIYKPGLAPFISEDQSKLFFSNVPTLIGFSSHLLSVFEGEFNKGAVDAAIGYVFAQQVSLLPIFVPYIERYLEASSELTDLINNNKKFSKAVVEFESEHEPLTSLIVMPVQRLPKYILLLTEILKYTPEWHKDHKNLKLAIEKMKDAAKQSDMKCRESNRRNQLVQLQNSLRKCPNLIAPARTVIGKWKMAEPKTELNLLSDMIIVTKEKVETLSRKKYKVLKLDIDLSKVTTVSKDPSGILLLTTGADVKLKVNEKVDQIIEAIEQQIQKFLLAKISTSSLN